MLVDKIRSAQEGNQEAQERLLLKFNPLIIKYSRKLFWEDAYQDLILDFIELIHHLPLDTLRSTEDGHLVNYIARSIRHAYIKQLNHYFNQPKVTTSTDDATEAMKLHSMSYEDRREAVAFCDLLDGCPALTEMERNILTDLYYWGYSSAEIARKQGTSRQNVNQIKHRALKKMRKSIQKAL